VIEAVRLTTRVAAPADVVWQRVTSPEGINHELRPWLRMTMPRSMHGKTIADVEPGKLGRSWLLLGGVIPVDYDDLGLAEVGPGYRFLERSTMASMRRWEHERSVEPAGENDCEVSDRVAFELRRPLGAIGLSRPVAATLKRFFERRHQRLAAYFGD
jgi:ligand-binding SRPBCC domain-containing protein